MLKVKLGILYSTKTIYRNKGKFKTFSDIQKLIQFDGIRHAQQEMLNSVLYDKEDETKW